MIHKKRPLMEADAFESRERNGAPRNGGPTGAGTGFRLDRLEVLNWGTFDGQVYSVDLDGQTALLVGQNGSGKSTLVDALLTLLVRPGVRNFNVAAGAKKRERTERTYFEGAYDRNADEEGPGIRTQCLRSSRKHTSVILAVFRNPDSGRSFTVAQVLYWSGQGVEKIYCFSDDERSISGDFGGLASTEGLVNTLKDRGFQASKTFSDFERWFRKVTRVKTKAMEVFNQTVAVKDIHRLNDFIRNHMLEPHNWSEKVDGLLAHFTQLNEAHQSLVKVRQQSELLEPVAAIGRDYRGQAETLERAERQIAAIDAFFAQKTIDLFTPELESRSRRLEEVRSLKASLTDQIENSVERGRQLKNEIEQAGGQRLREIPLLMNNECLQADAKRQAWERYHGAIGIAGIEEEIHDETPFAALRPRLAAMRQEVDRRVAEVEEARETLVLERGEVRRELNENRDELEGLSRRRENLPEWCVSLRSALCEALGLPAKELPFVSELLAVSPDEREWEASIEKVLRGFALSLLVPERRYHLVSRYVEENRLTARGRGQRLVYLRVAEPVRRPSKAVVQETPPHPQSLLRKLAYRDGHPMLPWVRAELADRFDYRCCETIDEFQRSRGLAMTRSRHVRSGTSRHDKDDRDRASDPRNFVLGWDNREKQRRIAEEIVRLEQPEERRTGQIARHDEELNDLRQRSNALNEAGRFTTFHEIDYSRHEREIAELEREKRAIEEQSEAIRFLKERLGKVESHLQALQASRDEAVAGQSDLEKQITQARRLIDNADDELSRYGGVGMLDEHRRSFADLDAVFQDRPLTVENFFESKDAFRRTQEQTVSELRRKIDPVKERLLEAMNRFLRQFPEETDLNANCEYLDSFLGLRQRVMEEDLPRHEQRFKDRLNEKVTHEIGLFRGALDTERRDIEAKIDILNESLKRLEYRPGMYLLLEPQPVRDPEIIEFQRKLRECIEGSFDDSPEANEARFLRIRDLVVKLQDENLRRWREKVTDVRRWFDFVANVIDRHSLERISSYDDSTGQSGGEKAKLAFTILVAAIAYQYDLDPEHPAGERFQFVVVDEMFSKVDDQYAEYALELFRQFGLQLLIVAPLDAKARVTQPYVGCYLHVDKRDNRSQVLQVSAREFEETVEQATNGESTSHPQVHGAGG